MAFFDRWPVGPYESSQAHRNTQRANGFTSTLTTGVQAAVSSSSPSLGTSIAPYTIIPTKFFQTGLSIYTMLRQDIAPSERIINGCQAAIEGVQLGLAITLLFKNEDCSNSQAALCNAAFLFQLLYLGLLLGGWGPSELVKAPYPALKKTSLVAERELDITAASSQV